MYVSSSVCFNCSKLVANSGVDRVVMRVDESMTHRDPKTVIEFLLNCGLKVEAWKHGYSVVRMRVSYHRDPSTNAVVVTQLGPYGSLLV